jgi:uncharacterized coiled-coil DUF342 family protein
MLKGKTMYANAILTELIALYESKEQNEKIKKWVKELRFVRLHLSRLSLDNDELKEEVSLLNSKIIPLEAAYSTMYRKFKQSENDLFKLKENLI